MFRPLFISVLAVFTFSSGGAYAKEHVITQKDKAFSVKEINAKVGDKLKFVNAEDIAHHIMFKDGGTRISEKQKDKNAEAINHTIENEGSFTVRCAIHPKMKLKVTVTK